MDRSTIAAIATPPGSAGIGIIKISGPDAVPIALSIFKRNSKHYRNTIVPTDSFQTTWQSHHLYRGYIVDPEIPHTLDEVLLSLMKAPNTYTGEDVAEINSHSGPVVLRAIMDLVLRKGARLATPGEFTKRAFLNGRIDLTQAEAVMEIINARTEKVLDIAAAHLKGEFKNRIATLREKLMSFMSRLEASIEFPEDVDSVENDDIIETLQHEFISPLEELVANYQSAHIFREGLTVAVAGRPNVGKSSLMNRLLQKDRMIVSPIPGTTRDFVEETIELQGIAVAIADMAGLHQTNDPVEMLGVQKAREYIKACDLVLFMLDSSIPLGFDDILIFKMLETKKIVLVLNKQDLVTNPDAFLLPDGWKELPFVRISALYNQGIDHLKDLIVQVSIGTAELDIRDKMIPNFRHKQLLDQCLLAIHNAVKAIRSGLSSELVLIDLQEAADTLAEIMGIQIKTDILDHVFSQFCVGK